MSHPNESPRPPAAPSLSALLARYVERQSEAQAAGFGMASPTGEVVPYEAVPVQPVDARLAWQEVRTGLNDLCPAHEDTSSWPPPPDWPTLVAVQEPAAAVPMAAGTFPQLVRNIQPLLHEPDLTRLRPAAGRPLSVAGLVEWATQPARLQSHGQSLLAAGCLRLARHLDQAAAVLQAARDNMPAEWQTAWSNEWAALAWQRGAADEAAALWQGLPESPAVLFNRGLALLFLGQPGPARPWLSRAVEQLPDSSGWHHLGRLYLAVAEMRL